MHDAWVRNLEPFQVAHVKPTNNALPSNNFSHTPNSFPLLICTSSVPCRPLDSNRTWTVSPLPSPLVLSD